MRVTSLPTSRGNGVLRLSVTAALGRPLVRCMVVRSIFDHGQKHRSASGSGLRFYPAIGDRGGPGRATRLGRMDGVVPSGEALPRSSCPSYWTIHARVDDAKDDALPGRSGPAACRRQLRFLQNRLLTYSVRVACGPPPGPLPLCWPEALQGSLRHVGTCDGRGRRWRRGAESSAAAAKGRWPSAPHHGPPPTSTRLLRVTLSPDCSSRAAGRPDKLRRTTYNY